MKPRWVTHEEYYDSFYIDKSEAVLLDKDRYRMKYLIASKEYAFLKPIIKTKWKIVYDYYDFIGMILLRAEKKGLIIINRSQEICWKSIKEWRKAAINERNM